MCQVIWLEFCSMIWYIYHFSKYCFYRFWSLSMCSWSYIIVSEIIGIPMPFSFPIMSYRFHFWWKKYENKSDRAFYQCFQPFSSLVNAPSQAKSYTFCLFRPLFETRQFSQFSWELNCSDQPDCSWGSSRRRHWQSDTTCRDVRGLLVHLLNIFFK